MKNFFSGIAKFCFLLTLFVLVGCPSPVKPPEKITITYDAGGHGTAPEKKLVDKGSKLSENDLPELTETDWFFCGWEIDGRKAIVGEPVNKDITLKAIWKTDIPEFSITAGEIDYQTEVELSYFRQDAVIYYTVNGSEPTEGSLVYSEPLEITADTTIKALAIKDGKKSQIATAEYKLKLYTVTFETNGHGLAPESMKKHKWEQIELPDVIPEATLQFDCWTNGIDNYNTGEIYYVTRDVAFTAKWIGLKDVKAPKIRPEGDYVDFNDLITITSETEDATILYSTDGTEPSAKSQKYTGPFALKTDTVIKAIAAKEGMNNSLVFTKAYKIKKYSINFDATGHGVPPEKINDKVKDDVIKLPSVLISENGWTFDKWNDGTNDYDAGAEYTIKENVTFAAKWVEWEQVASPSFSVAPGEVDYGTKVSVTSTTEGAVIYYTTDGSEPTAASTKYESEIEITADMTIKAVAVKSGLKDSDVASAGYTIKLYTVKFDANGHGTAPESMTGYKGQTIKLPAALTESGFTFDKWNDGTADYDAGAEYTIKENVTFAAKWVEWEQVASPSFSVAPGEVKRGTKVSITSTTEGAGIYYTTDGSEPMIASPKYETEIEITADVTIKAIAVKDRMTNSNVTKVKYTVDSTPPAPVTNLSAKCTASGTVKLTWTNPSDADFAKVVITYGTAGKVEVLKTATPNNEATVTALTDGTEYTFTVNAYDNAGNVSSGVNKKCTPFLGTAYNATNNGGLEGYTNQTQGAVIKETWMETNGNLKIGAAEISKTSEVVVVPTGTVATVTMPDDSSWNSYYSGSHSWYKGVFLKDRNVKLDPFVMSQYQVTQKLYNEVMGNNPSSFNSSPYGTETQENRPVEQVTWCQACAFCNELTKKTFGATTDQCVYYSDEALTTPYTATDAGNKTTPYIAYNTTTKKWTKTGYRLPTEAEWEFAARGGDPNAKAWSYAYAGSQTKKEASMFIEEPYNDDKIESYAWYSNNASSKTHEVGLKEKNTLNLYDMSGNVWEWCYDWNNDTASSNDSAYTVDGYVQNPVGASGSGSDSRCRRGGSYDSFPYYCAVSCRYDYIPSNCSIYIGFRVCRSTN